MSRTNKLLAYLEAKGVLAKGTPEEIAAAKDEYRKLYEREYKRKYRKAHVEIRFTLDSPAITALDATLIELDIDRSMYAKEATLTRLKGKRPASESRLNREALQKITLIHSEVRHLCRQRPTGLFERRIVFDRLEKRINALEEMLRESLCKDL